MASSTSRSRSLLDKLTLRTRPDQQTEYRHTALDTTQRQIRLLKVDTRYESNHFIVELFPLESAPSYLALSYTWGKPKPTRRIYVDERRLKVRLNLYQFLRVFAQRHRADYIWVDQISIDQDTAGERNHQVQFMGDIYKQASQVIIWLGKQEYSSRCRPEKIMEYHPRYHRKRHRDTMTAFFENPYWRRLWVVQEIILARSIKIYYGSSEISWYLIQISAAVRRVGLTRVPGHVQWLADNSNRTEFVSLKPKVSTTPFEAWEHFEDHHCQDPRDRYYALQGLFEPRWRLAVDYEKPVEQVFVEAAAMILWSCGRGSPGFRQRQSVEGCWKLAWRMGVGTLEDLGLVFSVGYAVLAWWWVHNHDGTPLESDECTAACTESLKHALRDACNCKRDDVTEGWLQRQDQELEAEAGPRVDELNNYCLRKQPSGWLRLVLDEWDQRRPPMKGPTGRFGWRI